MNKHALFIPFMALLATSCGGGHITTTPVVNAPSVAFTRKNALALDSTGDVGCVDLGSLSWAKITNNRFFTGYFAHNNIALHPSASNVQADIVCNDFTTKTASQVYTNTFENSIAMDENGNLSIFVSSDYYNSTDAETFKSSQSGNFLYYRLGTSGQTAEDYFTSQGYSSGYSEGLSEGYDEGYNDGLDQGRDEGYSSGYDAGYSAGYDADWAQSTLTSFENSFEGLLFFPSKERIATLCKAILNEDIYWTDFIIKLEADEEPTGSVDALRYNAPYFAFQRRDELAVTYIDIFQRIPIYENGNYFRDNAVQVGLINVSATAENNGNNYTNWLYQWNTYLWKFDTAEQRQVYRGTPLLAKFDRPCHSFEWKTWAIDTQKQVDGSEWRAWGATPDATETNSIKYSLDRLLAGAGMRYLEGYRAGYDDAVETGEAYDNIFMVFAPAFHAVGSFFNMSIGPIKIYYFFVIPLIIALLVLVIKLVKH